MAGRKKENSQMNKVFTDIAWGHYLYWQTEDKKILKKINELIRDIERNGNVGLGKPEPLKYELSGFWSRRITDEHRLIYSIEGNDINIVSCRNHYL
jgi:toxin YoeB